MKTNLVQIIYGPNSNFQMHFKIASKMLSIDFGNLRLNKNTFDLKEYLQEYTKENPYDIVVF